MSPLVTMPTSSMHRRNARSLNQMPRLTLYVSSLDASFAIHLVDAAHSPICTLHFAQGKPQPPALSALKFVPSLSLRGHPASWRRISQLGHVARCRASITCARGMCAALGGRQRACGMKLAGDSGRKRPACAARRRHAKRASRLVCPASLHCHAEGLSCVCCSVLGNARRGETVGHQPHGPLLSPRERAGRDQDH